MNKKPTILFLINELDFFISHRLWLADAAKKAGYEVHVAAASKSKLQKSKKFDFVFHKLHISRSGINPVKEFFSFCAIFRLYYKLRPDIVHQVTIKPMVYGSFIARLLGVPAVVNAVSGLGYSFINKGVRAKISRAVLMIFSHFGFNHANLKFIFQNPDDLKAYVDCKLTSDDKAILIKGSGVDINKFVPMMEPSGAPLVLMASRMLWDKGVGEFVASARLVKQHCDVRFILVGDVDVGNPSNISNLQLKRWVEEGVVEWWGWQENIKNILAQSHVVCLPSYREGLPRILIEAAACGKPIVTTETPGCRDIVIDGYNGFLVPVKAVDSLALAIRNLIVDSDLREQMGKKGREVVVSHFSQDKVIKETFDVYQKLGVL